MSHDHTALFRAELSRRGLDGFLVPRQDEFQGEYVAPYAERLKWLTGFQGSWGMAICMMDRGAIFVDGRYTIQVREQVDTDLYSPRHLADEPPSKWMETELRPGEVLGYDPWLLTPDHVKRFEKACEAAGAKFVAITDNPIDAVWADQPARPLAPVQSHPTQFAGQSLTDKLKNVSAELVKSKADAIVLTTPDSVAWIFNIRGGDVSYTPIALAFAIVHANGKAELFIDEARTPEDVRAQLGASVAIKSPAQFLVALGGLKSRVLIDPDWVPEAVRAALAATGAEIVNGKDPCVLMKARKNPIEQEGTRLAHRRDGVAMVRFLRWLESAAPKGRETELSAAARLEFFRQATGELKDLSFNTISAAGPHAAIPHYSVDEASNLPVKKNEIFLIDSGGQYLDGTTDITRTVMIGKPTDEMKDRFTRVLKGMIGISRLRFPKGTCGSQMDVLARQSLWSMGLDFDHGTGHGVGSYLSVHEGPARINKSDRTPFEPGMILSNEPGFYKAGSFGIRIENLLLVREAEAIPGGERPMHWFETLTLAPIDRRLIAAKLLTVEERDWLNAYHARVERELSPLLAADDAAWLKKACAKI